MTDTAAAWRSASASGQGSLKPDPGLYDAEVTSAKLQHRNSDGRPFIVMGYRSLGGGQWAGHEWEEITSVQPETFGLLKGVLSGVGRDPDAVDPDDLEYSLIRELQAAVGSYVTVEVRQRGEYRNTMPMGVATPVPSSDLGENQGAEYGQPPAKDGDDEPVPF
jgi:hypothetical protein